MIRVALAREQVPVCRNPRLSKGIRAHSRFEARVGCATAFRGRKIRDAGLGDHGRKPIYNSRAELKGYASEIEFHQEPIEVPMSERGNDNERLGEFDVAVEEARPKLKRPPLYRVVLINDDYTPMEFVVDILETVFSMERTRATQVMLEVHTKGKGVCGVYNYEIAETKVAQVMGIARQHQHPLLCTMEES